MLHETTLACTVYTSEQKTNKYRMYTEPKLVVSSMMASSFPNEQLHIFQERQFDLGPTFWCMAGVDASSHRYEQCSHNTLGIVYKHPKCIR